jgi:hypothetical protein
LPHATPLPLWDNKPGFLNIPFDGIELVEQVGDTILDFGFWILDFGISS